MFHRRALRLLVVLAALTLVMTILPATPVAAASCFNRGCDFKNPDATGCSTGAVTIGSVNIFGNGGLIGKVELRHSAACAAYWSRVTSYIGAQNLHAQINRYVGGQLDQRQTEHDFATLNFSLMLGATTEQVAGCGAIGTGSWSCRWQN